MIKGALKSKTMQFSMALAVLGVLETQYRMVENFVPEEYRGLVFVGIGVITAVLRVVTTEALSEK